MVKPRRRVAPLSFAPSERELSDIRRLLKRAGGERNLQRWIRIAGSRRRGRPNGSSRLNEYDNEVLDVAGTISLARLLAGKKEFSLHAIFQTIAEGGGPLGWTPERGSTRQAMVKRLLRKVRDLRVVMERERESFSSLITRIPPQTLWMLKELAAEISD
jgi:hypothetical protein